MLPSRAARKGFVSLPSHVSIHISGDAESQQGEEGVEAAAYATRRVPPGPRQGSFLCHLCYLFISDQVSTSVTGAPCHS